MDCLVEDVDRYIVQASGALRGIVVGMFRVVTRPAQMKVLIWLAKRRYKNIGANKSPNVARPHLLSNVAVECCIGAAMYDVFDRTNSTIKSMGTTVPGGDYIHTMLAGSIAGGASALMNTPHNNLIEHHADTNRDLKRALRSGELTLTGSHGVFHGLRVAIVRDSVAVGVMFTSSLWFKRNLPQPPPDNLALSTAQASMAGGLAGMVSALSAMVFQKASSTSTQYAGSHFFTIIRKVAAKDAASLPKYVAAGVPPFVLAAFVPNAIGMGVFHLGMELNKKLEEEAAPYPDEVPPKSA